MLEQIEQPLQIVSSWNAYQAACPTRLMLNRIADKWTVLVLGLLESETKRFSTLQREIGGISQKMLTQTLRGLERDGLIARTVYPEVPPRVEYKMTPLGNTLVGLLAALRDWSETHMDEVLQAQRDYDQAQQAASNIEAASGVRVVRF
ncbi:helix-turn-helix domain-containing protein [Methylophilus sp. VKM B-3414]|uniref:winged helix-turn-helix transcriptional regulator n=1 Tax=Methylophilus sp. VKM B-3414 TaxID=3076121 RepID=UPI0028C7410B|nr:helix-turn-helix domain-containing protein [Methylophilus sp. VKM B-3414]MDT7850024.1 helix-turn-helix domain-containing protein [Methylophilus sp. VKM B-3414]